MGGKKQFHYQCPFLSGSKYTKNAWLF